MGTITLVVLGLTLAGMALGALFGFMRGRERALLRLVLVIISAVLALALRGTIVDLVMNINIEGATLQETLTSSFASGEASMPEGITNLIFVLMEIVIGFVAYFVLLFALRFLSWLLVFPFLKLIIRVFEKKRAEKIWNENVSENNSEVVESTPEVAEPEVENNVESIENEIASESENTEDNVENTSENLETDVKVEAEVEETPENIEPVVVKACESTVPVKKISVDRKGRKKALSKHRGWGALVGLVQGVLVAYFLFAPLTCLLTQVTTIANIKMGDKALFEIPEDIGITEYSESAIGKFYNATGYWYYDIMTTATDAKGNKVSLTDTLDSISVIMEVANVATSLEEDLMIFSKEDATPEEKISSLQSLSDKLISVGTSMEKIDDNTKDMIKDLVTEMGGEEASQEEIDDMIEMLTPEFFTQAGTAMKNYADYEQVKLDGTELSQEKANEMVDAAYASIKLAGDVKLDVNEGDKVKFKTAIDAKDITAEDKEKLYQVFDIQIEQ